jgi:DNA helicase-2/ATP-dependent DNA helicase PcrA
VTSRFVQELGTKLVENAGRPSAFKTDHYVKVHESADEQIGDNKEENWKVGDLVVHDVFGKGVIVAVKGNYVDVAFSVPHGMKTLMSRHKALKRLHS